MAAQNPSSAAGSGLINYFNLWWGIAGCAVMMVLIFLLAPYNLDYDFAPKPEGHPMWYLWQLQEPTFWSRATAWGGYFLHQVSIWWLIYYAQTERPTYSKTLHRMNVVAIATNIFFVGLHIAQTKIWYDGLAQDVPEWTSMASVIVLMIMVLLMENQRRGLFFGQKVPGLQSAGQIARRYHGYYFSWAVIYTFWYHPIEITAGHLAGTFYTLLLLLQGSLFFTQFHRNRYWTVLLETFVLIHAILVGYFTITANPVGGDSTRFIFGLTAIFIVTQMHGLGFSRALRWLLGGIFALSIVLYYSGQWHKATDIFVIPVGSYAAVVVLTLLIWLMVLIPQKLHRMIKQPAVNTAEKR